MGYEFTCSDEKLHIHASAQSSDCQGWVLNCGYAADYQHTHSSATSSDCQGYTLICRETPHTHSDDCYTHYYNMKLVGNTEADNGNEWKSVTIKVVCGDNKPAAGVTIQIVLTDATPGNASAPVLNLTADTNSLGVAAFEVSSTYNHVSQILVAGEEKEVHAKNGLGNLSAGSGTWHDSYTFTVQHDYAEKSSTATCTKAGVTIKVCNYCANILREEVAALGHIEVALEAVEATCTTTGLTEGTKCSRCNATLKAQETVAALGHVWDEGEVTTAATCENTGVKTYTCSRTGCSATDTNVIPATGHNYDSGTVTTEATCTEDGVKTFTCQNNGCTASYTSEIPLTGHTVDNIEATDPTCTEAGNTEGTYCNVCQEILTGNEVIDATGHNIDAGTVTTPATCTENGVKTFTCINNGCGYSYTETIPAKGHTASEWQVIDEPALLAVGSCTEDREIKYEKVCTECGIQLETKTETQKAPGHVTEEIPAVDATCETAGLTVGTRCTTCGDILDEQKVVEALGHVWGDGVVTVEPTLETEGVMTYTCANDLEHTKSEVIPVLTPVIVVPEESTKNEESGKTEESEESSETTPAVKPQQPEQEVEAAVVDKPENSQTSPVETTQPAQTTTTEDPNRPNTGDRAQTSVYLVMLFVSFFGIVVVTMIGKQKKYNR